MKQFTLEELKKYDGKEGRRAYICYKGKIYDITDSKLWRSGAHMRLHFAGMDLTGEVSAAPHDTTVLNKFEVVGELVVPKSDQEKTFMDKLQDFYTYIHPHPILVHYPMAFVPFSLLMQILFLYFGNNSFYLAGAYSLICAFIGSLAATSAGVFSWWVNYRFKLNTYLKYKIVFSAVLNILLVVELWMLYNQGSSKAYTTLLFINMIPLLTIGYNGGKLTWHTEK